MPTATILCGVSGTGKSTYATGMKKRNPDLHIVSTDDIIDEMATESGMSYSETFYTRLGEAKREMGKRLVQAMREQRDICWDQINISLQKRARARTHLQAPDYRVDCVYFEIDDETEWRERIAARGPERYVPETALHEMRKRLMPPVLGEGFVKITKTGLGREILATQTGDGAIDKKLQAKLPEMKDVVLDFRAALTYRYLMDLMDVLDKKGVTDLAAVLQWGTHVIRLQYEFWLNEENMINWYFVEDYVVDKLKRVHRQRKLAPH